MNKEKYKKSGFTLVELLVVVVIIAILATIGLVLYTGAQKQARDAKRIGDIDAIAKALETKKGTSTYQALSSTDFTNGIPIDPLQSTWDDWATEGKCGTKTSGYPSRCWYCKNNNNSSVRKTSPGNCNSDDWSTGDSNWGTGVTDWIICANLETGSPSYYCRSNQR